MLRRIGLVVGLRALGLSLVGAAPPAAPAPAPTAKPAAPPPAAALSPAIEEAFKQLAAYQFGQSRAARKKILAVSTDTAFRQQAEEILREVGAPAERP